ncbi:hypothetical protein QWZ08_10945 [Ferruginibacter paludis]|uniref:hypothetical protein n=1 Tax=Ferruginibacter paludis TaxID=1310417 RepID=UPI0025B4B4EE|nr:hypothetical protein [Ferruginibacter paludis]MDN3656146.1 hypothetical protein [Ferruginibacter paludis]
MKPYLSKGEATNHLQKRGFKEDFELFGTDLLWKQRNIFLRPWEFYIVEAHRFLLSYKSELVVFAIKARGNSVKGILINHYKRNKDKIPPVINRKLLEMDVKYLNEEYDYLYQFHN